MMARTPKMSIHAHFWGCEGGGSQKMVGGAWWWQPELPDRVRTWWQLNDGQNPKNEHECSFLGSQGWWRPENGCGHGGGSQTMVGA